MRSWKNWWCHSTARQRENPGGPWISFSCPGHNMQDLQTSKAETFTLDIPRELTVRLRVRLLWKRENYTEVMKVHRNWRNNGQIPLVNLMHGKGPIYVELHCTVMARRTVIVRADISWAWKLISSPLKILWAKRKWRLSESHLSFSIIFPLFLFLFIVFVCWLSWQLRKPKKNHANPCKKTMHILTGVSAPSAKKTI